MTTPAEDATLAKIIARHEWAASHGVTSPGREDIENLLRMLRVERANSEGLRKALEAINRRASPQPSRTFDQCSDDLYWCACETRRALSASPSPNDLPGNWRTPEQVREQLLGDEDLLR